jgi:hypothetical protein
MRARGLPPGVEDLAAELADYRSRLDALELAASGRTRAVATGARPSAGSVPEGTQLYDTTLNVPIWSDGATWRNAAGTAV